MNINVERGTPTPEELAALVGVLAGTRSSTSEPRPRSSAWWRSGLPSAQGRPWRESTLPKMSHP